MNPQFVLNALGLKPSPTHTAEFLTTPFVNISTDSRKVQPGSLFVALKGEKFDAHDFLDSVVAQGAKGVICRRGMPIAKTAVSTMFFEVDDTLDAYRALASAWRREFSIPIIMIAGSAGKTTTKELLAAILHGRFSQVLKTIGSQNGYVGIPMTLLELRPEHGAAVIEVGIDEIGAMKKHVHLVEASSAVLTAIGPEHLENLIDVPTVAREENIALSSVAQSGGMIAVNLDDPWISPSFSKLEATRKIGYTLSSPVEKGEKSEILRATLVDNGTAIELRGMGLDGEKFVLPLLGEHNALNLLAAITLARGHGLTAQEMRTGLSTFSGAEGRSQIRTLKGEITVLCDYYNAQPASVAAGLELLTQLANRQKGARWACLGDMLELGAEEERFHREIAQKLLPLSIENVLLYGPRMKALADELAKRTYPGKVLHFSSHAEMAQAVNSGLKPGDSLIIKGSRSMKMEEVWKLVEANFKT